MFLAEDLGEDLDLGVRGLDPRVQISEPSRGCRSAVTLDRAEQGLSFILSDDTGFSIAGPVGGSQIAQHAETTAALAAVCTLGTEIDLMSDSRYVVNGIAAIAAGAQADEWRNADLWMRIAPHARNGHLRARWTPAQLEAGENAAPSLAEADRAGNARADSAAGGNGGCGDVNRRRR